MLSLNKKKKVLGSIKKCKQFSEFHHTDLAPPHYDK